MVALVIAEHHQTQLTSATLSTIAAAQICAKEIHLLVVGYQCEEVARSACQHCWCAQSVA